MAAVLVRLCGAARAPSLRPWAALSTGTRRLCVQLRSGSSSLGTATGRLCVQLRGAALGSLWLFFVVRLWAASCTSLWVSLGGFAQHLCAASWYFFVGQLGRLAQHFQYYFVVLYGTRDRAETGGSSSSSVTLLRCSIPSALLLRIPQTEIFHTENLPGCHFKKRKTATANVFLVFKADVEADVFLFASSGPVLSYHQGRFRFATHTVPLHTVNKYHHYSVGSGILRNGNLH